MMLSKYVRRALSLTMAFCLVVSFSLIGFADSIDNFDGYAVQSVTGAELSDALTEFIESYDIEISDSTVITLAPINGARTKSTNILESAVCITNNNDGVITKDVLLALVKKDDGTFGIDENLSEAVMNAQTRGSAVHYYPPEGRDDAFVIRGTAAFDDRYDGSRHYYRPYGCYFTYFNYQGVSVDYITLSYYTGGNVYSYPGFSYLSYQDSHTIVVSKSSPNANTMYSATDYYPSDRAIDIYQGSDTAGCWMTFEANVDGQPYSYSLNLIGYI